MIRPVVLLVEPNPSVADMIEESIRPLAQVYFHREFESARRQLAAQRFDFVVSNLRLRSFNGLHLAYAVNAVAPTRCVIYTESREPALAQDVRRAGAFYEVVDRLPVTLTAYLAGKLPPPIDGIRRFRIDARRFAEGGGSGTGSCSRRLTEAGCQTHYTAQTAPGSIHPPALAATCSASTGPRLPASYSHNG